jgi:hypothetical protein
MNVKSQNSYEPSFPRRRESTSITMDSRLRGNDRIGFGIAFFITIFTINSVAAQAVNTLDTSDKEVEVKVEDTFFSMQESPWLVLGGLAYHSCRTCKFRERNPGLALQWKSLWFEEFTGLQNTRLTAGGYINSNNRDSVYAGAQWLPYNYGPVKLGLQAVLITGYKEAVITPVLLPLVSVETQHAGVDLYAVPKMAKVSAAVFATFKVKF